MRRLLLLIVVLVAGGLPAVLTAADAAGSVSFYVSPAGSDANNGLSSGAPFRTIPHAQQAARAAIAAGAAVQVNLMPGTFKLTTPLSFGAADSGRNGVVTWQAADPSNPPVISGERDIVPTGSARWTYNPILRVWSLPNVTRLDTRDLWVNGHRASRVHSCVGTEPCGANNSFNPANYQLTANGARSGTQPPNPSLPAYTESLVGRVHTYLNPGSADFVYRFDGEPGRHGSPWAEPRCGIASVVATAIVMKSCFATGREANAGTDFHIDLPSGVENAYELFDPVAHGDQWYWNPTTSTLFYQAEDGTKPGYTNVSEALKPPTSVVAGGLNGSLLLLRGASNLRFSGIDFAYTTWIDPNGTAGMVDIQTGLPLVYCGGECTYPVLPPAAVSATNGSNLHFVGDTFERLGAVGVGFGATVSSSSVESSTFRDIGDNAVMIGDTAKPGSGNPVAANNSVLANTFTNSSNPADPGFAVGAQYHSGVAIWSGYSYGLRIVGNNLCTTSGPTPCKMPSDGIAIGWGWDTPPPAGSVGNNTIANNAVISTMQWLWDGGAIYSVGVQPGELIRSNVIRDVPQTPGAIYLDQGNTNVTVLNNVIEQIHNTKDPFASPKGPQDEPAAAVYAHTCIAGLVRIFDNFFDSTPAPALSNSPAGCVHVGTVTMRGMFGGLAPEAMPASITGSAGTSGALGPPTAPGPPSGSATGPTSQLLSWPASIQLLGAVTGYEVRQPDPVYGTVVVGASTTTHVVAADPTPQASYVDTVYARDAAGNLSAASAPVTVRAG